MHWHHNTSSEPQKVIEKLSNRELEVLRLLAEGCSDKKIAETLVIARETVHKHLKIMAQPGKQGGKRKEVKYGNSSRDISWTLNTFAKAIDKRTKGEQSCGKSLSTTSSHWMGIIQA